MPFILLSLIHIYYKQSTLTGTGGGWLGGVLTSFLTIGLGKPGTFLVLVVLFIICMVCITERSFVSAVKRGDVYKRQQ